ncbi:hypothetical protein OG393_01130 [Streptomyces sp. NBC_01216]|uniref:hypothetical protein n=1 Tax=Streptomyces sp. NBC_01216 TaxID=2903778 RepID=UPI002E123EF9|nr:hypothetical protein OG393_01130 [Streptomyces sp. NBC_01216]
MAAPNSNSPKPEGDPSEAKAKNSETTKLESLDGLYGATLAGDAGQADILAAMRDAPEDDEEPSPKK